jgi:hypothetical protein
MSLNYIQGSLFVAEKKGPGQVLKLYSMDCILIPYYGRLEMEQKMVTDKNQNQDNRTTHRS